jgi:hypothetical protein
MHRLHVGTCFVALGLAACAHAPPPSGAALYTEAEESDAQLWTRCQQDDPDACHQLISNAYTQLPYDPDWRKDHPFLLPYAEPAAARLCRLNPAECPWLVDLAIEIRYPTARLLGDATVVADLQSICIDKENPEVCHFVGGLFARGGHVPEAVRTLVVGCRGIARGNDAGWIDFATSFRSSLAFSAT